MKRTEMKRSTPMPRGQGFQKKEPAPKKAKPRKCKCGCGETYMPNPARPFVNWATEDCGAKIAQAKLANIKTKARRQERAADRVKRETMKKRGELIAEAQAAVNAWVHWRDRNEVCIDCGKPFEPMKPGGSADAGHYLARSLAPHLRFNLDNIFRQRKNCNRPGGTTREAFREGVKARIGIERLEALEAIKGPAKWTHDDLRAIRDEHRAMLREAKKKEGQECSQ